MAYFEVRIVSVNLDGVDYIYNLINQIGSIIILNGPFQAIDVILQSSVYFYKIHI